jgi:DNA end-binding protein Ku
MARPHKHHRPKSSQNGSRNQPFHAFWSGSLSFGLVNVPVVLFPASRHTGVRLRMLSPRGSPLHRRFFCPRDDQEVDRDQIVRGYELDDHSYITVDDDELEALEPQKTREIDLREFVDLDELPPLLLERGYYLTPAKDAVKAYRLLADVMERTRRAGVATFVMREREYLIAIFARDGVLCAETLRFHDEIRDPRAIGLPEPTPAAVERVAAFTRSIDALSARTVPRDELTDQTTQALKALIEKKMKAGRDVVRAEVEPKADAADVDDEEEGDADLLETIRQSLRQSNGQSDGRARKARKPPSARPTPRRRKTAGR